LVCNLDTREETATGYPRDETRARSHPRVPHGSKSFVRVSRLLVIDSIWRLQFEMPPHIARPAKQLGEPAGGGLSADTYKGLGIVFLPAIVRLLFDETTMCG
jgi:hypothetical protein